MPIFKKKKSYFVKNIFSLKDFFAWLAFTSFSLNTRQVHRCVTNVIMCHSGVKIFSLIQSSFHHAYFPSNKMLSVCYALSVFSVCPYPICYLFLVLYFYTALPLEIILIWYLGKETQWGLKSECICNFRYISCIISISVIANMHDYYCLMSEHKENVYWLSLQR